MCNNDPLMDLWYILYDTLYVKSWHKEMFVVYFPQYHYHRETWHPLQLSKFTHHFINFNIDKKNKQWPPLIEDVLFENLDTFIRCSSIKQNTSKVSKSYSDNIETYHYVRFKNKIHKEGLHDKVNFDKNPRLSRGSVDLCLINIFLR